MYNYKLLIFLAFVSIILSGITIPIDAEDTPSIPININYYDDTPNYLIDLQSIPYFSTTESFLLFDNPPNGFGGYWADCEKSPSDPDDNLCCWAATASNMLEWTGWGFVPQFPGTPTWMDNTDDFLAYFNTHTSPEGGVIGWGIRWWFDGYLHSPSEDASMEEIDVDGFWDPTFYNYTDYLLSSRDAQNITDKISEWLNQGFAVGISICNKNTGKSGHAITVWGYDYDIRYDSNDPQNYYRGLYVTDSDDRKNMNNPPDLLRHIDIDFNISKNFWEFGSYKIRRAYALKPFPDDTRPVANAGGIYLKEGECKIKLNASKSYDDDLSDFLRYRWDLNNDGSWNTEWLSKPTLNYTFDSDFEGKVKLEVTDGRLRDVDFAYISDISITPTLIETVTLPKELYVLQKTHSIEFRTNYSDSIFSRLYNYEWSFGDGLYSDKPIVNHIYENPGTYKVELTVKFGSTIIGAESISITVISPTELLFNLNDFIQNLDSDNMFDKNPDNRKTALYGMLILDEDSVLNFINGGLFNNATEKLQMVKSKMDGNPNPKDWIIDADTQTEYCEIIDDLIYYFN